MSYASVADVGLLISSIEETVDWDIILLQEVGRCTENQAILTPGGHCFLQAAHADSSCSLGIIVHKRLTTFIDGFHFLGRIMVLYLKFGDVYYTIVNFHFTP